MISPPKAFASASDSCVLPTAVGPANTNTCDELPATALPLSLRQTFLGRASLLPSDSDRRIVVSKAVLVHSCANKMVALLATPVRLGTIALLIHIGGHVNATAAVCQRSPRLL